MFTLLEKNPHRLWLGEKINKFEIYLNPRLKLLTGLTKKIIKLDIIGTWRSLEAHLNGVQGVASSNLAVPTIFLNHLGRLARQRPAQFFGFGLFLAFV